MAAPRRGSSWLLASLLRRARKPVVLGSVEGAISLMAEALVDSRRGAARAPFPRGAWKREVGWSELIDALRGQTELGQSTGPELADAVHAALHPLGNFREGQVFEVTQDDRLAVVLGQLRQCVGQENSALATKGRMAGRAVL